MQTWTAGEIPTKLNCARPRYTSSTAAWAAIEYVPCIKVSCLVSVPLHLIVYGNICLGHAMFAFHVLVL